MEKTTIIQIENVNVQDFFGRLAEVVENAVQKSKTDIQNPEPELIGREDLCKLLGISKSTIWNWENEGKIQSVGIGAKRYFRKDEVLNALKPKN